MFSKYEKAYSNCPICESSLVQAYHHDLNGNKISICKNCNVQFMNPVYSDAYLDDYYSKYTSEEYSQSVIDEQRYTANDYLSLVSKISGRTGSMLDYGCGNGEHSNIGIQRGWDVVGYDVDCTIAKIISDKYNFEYLCDPFEEVDWNNKSFDLVYANQVVEHLKDPIKALKIIHGIVKDDGLVLVAVPNIYSLSRRIKFLIEKMGFRKGKVGKYYDAEHHIFYYNKNSISNMLKVAGFDVIYTANSKKAKLKQNKISKFIRRNITEKIIPNSALFVIAKKVKIDIS